LLGGGNESRAFVPAPLVADVLRGLVQTGQARWHAGGRRLVSGETRVFPTASAAPLPPRSGVILGETGPWSVDAASGAVGRIRVQPPVLAQRLSPRPSLAVQPVGRPRADPPRRRAEPETAE
jgi:hypothetical protein